MMNRQFVLIFALTFFLARPASFAQSGSQELTYAERLGFPRGSKVLILHIDDVGMSWDSNQGAIQAMEKGRCEFPERHDAVPMGSGICALHESASGYRCRLAPDAHLRVEGLPLGTAFGKASCSGAGG
jgi:hypothetical protein